MTRARRVAVVGHLEWIEFAVVDRVPSSGEIIHAVHAFEEPGGGGPVAAVQLRKLAGKATFYTALGDDELGHRAKRELEERHGVRVEAAFRPGLRTRRGFVFLDAAGERTITVIGDRLGPSGRDALAWADLETTDAVYFTAGDAGALAAARRARVLVATSRVMGDLVGSGVHLDALVGSARDPDEQYVSGTLSRAPGVVVRTSGATGGMYETADGRAGRFPAEPLPGPVVDSYGCGDSFAAGLTYALGAGDPVERALTLAARCGAACLTGRGPYAAQLAFPQAGAD